MKKIVVLILFAGMFFVACKKKQEIKDVKQEAVETVVVGQQEEKIANDDKLDEGIIDETVLNENTVKIDKVEEWNKNEVLEDIYFGFDKSNLTSESRNVLVKHANWLKEHPDLTVIIEGHCDERGTEQYNIALGDKRANTVKNYLMSLGISGNRLRTQSLGEIFPKVKEHSEWAWSQNRRAHFVLKK